MKSIDFRQVTIDDDVPSDPGGTATGFRHADQRRQPGVRCYPRCWQLHGQQSAERTDRRVASGIVAIGSASVVNAGSIAGIGTASDGIFLDTVGRSPTSQAGTFTGTPYGVRAANAEAITVSNTGHIISVTPDAAVPVNGVQLLAGSVTNAIGRYHHRRRVRRLIINGGYITNAPEAHGYWRRIICVAATPAACHSVNAGSVLLPSGTLRPTAVPIRSKRPVTECVRRRDHGVCQRHHRLQRCGPSPTWAASRNVTRLASCFAAHRQQCVRRHNPGAMTASLYKVTAPSSTRAISRAQPPRSSFSGSSTGWWSIPAQHAPGAGRRQHNRCGPGQHAELASGASAGTPSGLGTQFIDFAQSTIDVECEPDSAVTTRWPSGATLTTWHTDRCRNPDRQPDPA